MKIKNTLKIALLSVALMATETGCQKYLDLEPLSSANGEQIWGTATGCEQLLSGTYSLFRRTLLSERPFYVFSELPANTLLACNNSTIGAVVNGDFVGAYVWEWWDDWTPFYKVVTSANTLLNHIGDVEDTEFSRDAAEGHAKKMQITGQAHFLCAYAYFWLTRIYGDVPLVKEAIESVDQALESGSTIGKAQSTQAEVLEYCIKHLDAAIAKLEYDSYGSTTWAVTADKGSALGLKGHVCAFLAHCYKGTARETEMLQMAEDCLSKLMLEGGRELVDYSNEAAVTEMFNGKSPEGVFELNISIAQEETYWMGYDKTVHARTWWSQGYTNGNLIKYPETDLVVPDQILSANLYNESDIRRNVFYENFGNENKHKTLPPMLKKYSTGQQPDPDYSGVYLANSNVLLMRLTDIQLLRAEVLSKLGRFGQARILLNEIRNRAGIGDFSGGDGELASAIFDERVRELTGEGHAYFDRMRNDYWTGCAWINPDRLAKKGQYWPVYTYLISANRDLKQVPWWQGKK